MENNVIYLSDASYDEATCEAGIAVKNLTTKQTSAQSIHARSAYEAEEFALIEAINHAIEHHHRNCVFVYDNINIDTKRLGEFFESMFDKVQFLWMKRDYLNEVDKLACNVRLKRSKKNSLTKQIINHATRISDEALVNALMPLTRGEIYGYLCAISGTAPMMREYPNTIKSVNQKIIALLHCAGSITLKEQLNERFGTITYFKHKLYDLLLQQSGFTMSWFGEAEQLASKQPIAA